MKKDQCVKNASVEKDEMRQQILTLVAEVASLRTELKYLTDKRIGGI
jgi:hypothetical protein